VVAEYFLASFRFVVAFLTVVPFFRVEEIIRFGAVQSLPRRDLQPGSQIATAEELRPTITNQTITPNSGGSDSRDEGEGGVRLAFEWGAPNAGSLQEVYRMQVSYKGLWV
jgi:hypothetical protein